MLKMLKMLYHIIRDMLEHFLHAKNLSSHGPDDKVDHNTSISPSDT